MSESQGHQHSKTGEKEQACRTEPCALTVTTAVLWATSHINPEAPAKVSDSCACTLCHLLSCWEVKGRYSQGSAMWASFFSSQNNVLRIQTLLLLVLILLTHLSERILCLCSAANRGDENTPCCV